MVHPQRSFLSGTVFSGTALRNVVDIQCPVFVIEHPPGSRFPAPGGRLHYWSAVELEGNWRLVDTVCAARAAAVAENFFLPDPEEFIYTHFPHNQAEAQYFRWQLLLPPLR